MFTVLDLFSGIGGFALATEWAGGRTVAFCELAEYPSRVLAEHWPEVPNYRDITKLCRRGYDCVYDHDLSSAHCPRCDVEFGECACVGTDQFTDTHGFPDVVVGGVPCQPASLVGLRRGSADPRWLWPDTLRVLGELRPRFGIFENPRALLTLEGGRAFRGILSSFADLGYAVQWEVVSASALGAGHRRERLWILASDPHRPGLERHPRDGEAGRGENPDRHFSQSDLRSRKFTSPQWYRQSGLSPVVAGLPGKLAREQLTAVGNSLVPQVAYVWLKAISSFYDPHPTNP